MTFSLYINVLCVYVCVHMYTCIQACSCTCVCRCTWMSGAIYLGFYCLFLPRYKVSHWNSRACRLSRATVQEAFGLSLPGPQHWLGLQTCGPHAQLRTSCYQLSSMHHPCRAFSLLSLGLCTVCELCFCLFFLNVCLPGSGITGFLGSFWRVVLTVVCQFICALLGFIIFAFLRQVFTLLHRLPWNSV